MVPRSKHLTSVGILRLFIIFIVIFAIFFVVHAPHKASALCNNICTGMCCYPDPVECTSVADCTASTANSLCGWNVACNNGYCDYNPYSGTADTCPKNGLDDNCDGYVDANVVTSPVSGCSGSSTCTIPSNSISLATCNTFTNSGTRCLKMGIPSAGKSLKTIIDPVIVNAEVTGCNYELKNTANGNVLKSKSINKNDCSLSKEQVSSSWTYTYPQDLVCYGCSNGNCVSDDSNSGIYSDSNCNNECVVSCAGTDTSCGTSTCTDCTQNNGVCSGGTTCVCAGTTASCGTYSSGCVVCDTTPHASEDTCYYGATCTSNTCSQLTDSPKPATYYASGNTCYYGCSVTCTASGWSQTGCSSDTPPSCNDSTCGDGGWDNSACSSGCVGSPSTRSCNDCGTQTQRCDVTSSLWTYAGTQCVGYTTTTQSCTASNTYGSCSGTQQCLSNGTWGSCSAQTPAEEICTNGLDDDCNGEWDYDTMDRGEVGNVPPHGDSQCPISISSASSSPSSVYANGLVNISCNANVETNALFVYRDVNGNGHYDAGDVQCLWKSDSGWSDTTATFTNCSVGAVTGDVDFYCSVYNDSSTKPYDRAYMSGPDKKVSVTVVENPCLSYTDQDSCNSTDDCSWIGECNGDMLRSPAGCQLTDTLYTESCNVSCGADCDASSSVDNGYCNLTTCTAQCDDYFYYNETTASCTALPDNSCFDTDGGKNYTVKGKTSAHVHVSMYDPVKKKNTLIDDFMLENDSCSNDDDLTEYYCNLTFHLDPIKSVLHSCNDDSMICVDGACVEPCSDVDGDGYNVSVGGASCGSIDCNDTNASINPGAAENCTNGVDDNCDGLTDGQDSACSGFATLTGYVQSADGVLPGASVGVALPGEFRNWTNTTGEYTIVNVPSGSHSVVASIDNYRSETQQVVIPTEGAVVLNFTLDDGDCSNCADWESRCSVACSNTRLCDATVPDVCEGANIGDWVQNNSENYIHCCTGGETKDKLPISSVSGCMKDLVQFTRVVYYAGQPVTMHVYTWAPCDETE